MPHQPKPIPESIRDHYEFCDQAPSGLKHKVPGARFGKPAGTRTGNYWAVSHCGKRYYAHRVIYFLRHGDTEQIIRHTKHYDNHAPLLAGTQAENIADKKGVRSTSPKGYKSKYTCEVDGEVLSARQAALKLGVPYQQFLKQLKRSSLLVTC